MLAERARLALEPGGVRFQQPVEEVVHVAGAPS